MKQIKLIAVANFHQGAVLGLTKEQAAARSHLLKDLGKGKYEVLDKVQFKIGEQLGYEGELPNSIEVLVERKSGSGEGGDSVTVADLQKKLTNMGVEFPAKANKAKLLELVADTEAKAKAAEEAAKVQESADAEAKAAWESSDELKAEFPEVEDYIASLKQE